ncbi:HEPN domain-containing protein [Nocardiopsis dassonvillei]|uniref:HEPN domain-containing protein n=1 Tax=Nocardiopsis dassonvillei TaxID=2014 RepID=UPI00102C96B3|nr:HEPN domain-containing protein [Nocardiopsis dassonvillei]MCP3014820.1 HEPN domain-containing protein [Nocardiopsis dassonvillei]
MEEDEGIFVPDDRGVYYSPATNLLPPEEGEPIWEGRFGVIPRKWNVSIFDWAELATQHRVHLPWAAAESMLKSCNLEFAVKGVSLESTTEEFSSLKTLLYSNGLTPFSLQLTSNYSINEYAGISGRKSEYSREHMHEGLREGITNKTSKVGVWSSANAFPSLSASGPLKRTITSEIFTASARDVDKWRHIKIRNPVCSFIERVAETAPSLPERNQSLLHIWTGLEALFPRVQSEVSFRIALYLAQLQYGDYSKMEVFEKARRSYGDRSKISHGGNIKERDDRDPWHIAWTLLMDSIKSIMQRGKVPSEEELIEELLRESE